MRQCNFCDRKNCKYPSRNIYPKMKNKPSTPVDRVDAICPKWLRIQPGTMKLKEAARWTNR